MTTSKRLSTRRDFLQLGVAGMLGLSLPRVLRSEAKQSSPEKSTARNMILIWLGGGPATIDMWDPKPDAPDYIRGEFATIPTTVTGLRISEHLPRMADLMDHCTLIRSLTHSIPAHGPGSQYVLTGHLPSVAVTHPAVGSIVARKLSATAPIPPYIAFQNPNAGQAGYLGSAWNPFELENNPAELPRGVSLGDNVDLADFSERVRLRGAFDKRFDALNSDPIVSGLETFRQQAEEVLRRDSIRSALNLEQESDRIRESFGQRSPLGGNTLRAVRLIEAGARFVTVGMTGWDTHSNNFVDLRNQLLPRLDRALSALITALESRGLFSSTIVCCCGEFGRTPNINGNAGRDHWSRAMSVLVAGGGFKEGLVHGATDKLGGEPIEGECTPSDLVATILARFAIDPESTLSTPTGREMPIMRQGRVIESLFS